MKFATHEEVPFVGVRHLHDEQAVFKQGYETRHVNEHSLLVDSLALIRVLALEKSYLLSRVENWKNLNVPPMLAVMDEVAAEAVDRTGDIIGVRRDRIGRMLCTNPALSAVVIGRYGLFRVGSEGYLGLGDTHVEASIDIDGHVHVCDVSEDGSDVLANWSAAFDGVNDPELPDAPVVSITSKIH